jgi:hypothetical protein
MSSAVPPSITNSPHGEYSASAGNGPSARTIWLALAGAALPYATVAMGWWIADLIFHGRDDATWETAANWVYIAVTVAVGFGIVCNVPLLRRVRAAHQRAVLAVLIGIAYFFGLAVFNFIAYFRTSAPFP